MAFGLHRTKRGCCRLDISPSVVHQVATERSLISPFQLLAEVVCSGHSTARAPGETRGACRAKLADRHAARACIPREDCCHRGSSWRQDGHTVGGRAHLRAGCRRSLFFVVVPGRIKLRPLEGLCIRATWHRGPKYPESRIVHRGVCPTVKCRYTGPGLDRPRVLCASGNAACLTCSCMHGWCVSARCGGKAIVWR